MTDFDLLVIGGGTGNNVASAAVRSELDVALVEKGPLGGTCLIRGCDPSKTLIHWADLVEQIQRAERFGIDTEITNIDFSMVIAESNDPFDEKAEQMENAMQETENLELYKAEGRFVDERTVQVNDERITGEKVVAAGARPIIPGAITGIEDVNYVTSDEVLRLDERPDHLIIIGGGYIAAEMGQTQGYLSYVGDHLAVTEEDGLTYTTRVVAETDFQTLTRKKLADFIASVRREQKPAASGALGLQVTALTEAAYKADENASTVDVQASIKNAREARG